MVLDTINSQKQPQSIQEQSITATSQHPHLLSPTCVVCDIVFGQLQKKADLFTDVLSCRMVGTTSTILADKIGTVGNGGSLKHALIFSNEYHIKGALDVLVLVTR